MIGQKFQSIHDSIVIFKSISDSDDTCQKVSRHEWVNLFATWMYCLCLCDVTIIVQEQWEAGLRRPAFLLYQKWHLLGKIWTKYLTKQWFVD